MYDSIIFIDIGAWGSSLILFTIGITNTRDTTITVPLFILMMGLNSAVYTGSFTSYMDLSTNFCGTLMGLSSTIGAFGSIFGTLTTGWIVSDPVSIFDILL